MYVCLYSKVPAGDVHGQHAPARPRCGPPWGVLLVHIGRFQQCPAGRGLPAAHPGRRSAIIAISGPLSAARDLGTCMHIPDHCWGALAPRVYVSYLCGDSVAGKPLRQARGCVRLAICIRRA